MRPTRPRARDLNATVSAGLLISLGFLTARVFASPADSDLSWQRALGDFVLAHHELPTVLGAATFTTPGAHWLPHEWIFATLWALAHGAGLETIFGVGCTFIAFGALYIDSVRARATASRANVLSLTLLVVAMLPSFGMRAQVLAWPLLALLMLALDSGPRAAWWALPIALVWDNVHASGLIVPAIVLTYGLGRVITERRGSSLKLTVVIAAATIFASAATPFGLEYASFAAAWFVNPATSLITEWQPLSISTAPMYLSPFLIAGLLVAGELRGVHLSWSQRLLAGVLFAIALLHLRNIPLFCIVAAPWAAGALTAILPRESVRTSGTSTSDRGLMLLAWAGVAILVFSAVRVTKSYPDDPSAAIARVVGNHRAARVACEDFSWCSRFAETPGISVFIDGRLDAYPKAVFADFRHMLAGDADHAVERWNIDAVIARRDGPLARSLHAPRWQRVIGGETQLFVRD